MTPTGTRSIVITDTSILINLSHTGHVSLLGKTTGFRFVVPNEVIVEVTDPGQGQVLQAALAEGALSQESLASPDELEIYADLIQVLGFGESACLALAARRDWLIACDEKRVFLREAHLRLGDNRIINTTGLYVLWVRLGLLSVEQADDAKAILETNRFKMSIQSFRDIV